jgi:hypothetical protein
MSIARLDRASSETQYPKRSLAIYGRCTDTPHVYSVLGLESMPTEFFGSQLEVETWQALFVLIETVLVMLRLFVLLPKWVYFESTLSEFNPCACIYGRRTTFPPTHEGSSLFTNPDHNIPSMIYIRHAVISRIKKLYSSYFIVFLNNLLPCQCDS